jgi:crotonobetainyl-CoA:carnitine CoA-transferase CaiB-like acyl-CoA transferase
MTAIDREDLANDPSLKSNPGRVAQQQLIDAAIGGWTSAHSSSEVIATLEQVDVPVGPIYSIADAFADPHYQARGMFEEVDTPNGKLKIPAILPKLSATPGQTTWAGGEVGSHTDEVLQTAGFSAEEISSLRKEGDI